METDTKNYWLLAGGILSALAALLHLCVIIGGGAWYRFFGAGEDMARMAEQGSVIPGLVTLAIAVLLAIWALYAFSAMGWLRALPLTRTALVMITSIYLLRGLSLFPLLLLKPQLVDAFTLWSSLIVLLYGLTYALGTWQAWPMLTNQTRR